MAMLTDILAALFQRNTRRSGAADVTGRPVDDLIQDLLSARGENTGAAAASEILDRYGALDDAGRTAFFDHLAAALDVDLDRVQTALETMRHEPTLDGYAAYLAAVEPPRQELARRLNRVPGATHQLVEMRADLLRLLPRTDPRRRIDLDFLHLFASWFNRGFLVLRRISWESPAHILEKIIAYEAVHAISSWEELRRRVEPPDRRCFAFFHPAMPDEPLIFVEVALGRGIPGSIGEILAEDRDQVRPGDADTAVFYSISNCQPGLAGVSFGNSLIKQVVVDLAADLPALRTFVTLSPVPLLTQWLRRQRREPAQMEPDMLAAAAARYLLEARRGDGLPYDPVARFHLGNGAEVHALHLHADPSPKGVAESGGVMVNYLYDLSSIGRNHESYAVGRIVAASPAIRSLARSFHPATEGPHAEPAL